MKVNYFKKPSEISAFFYDLINRNPAHAKLIVSIILLCVLPAALNLVGIDFGIKYDLSEIEKIKYQGNNEETFSALHSLEKGSFVHTILETICFLTAIFTVVFAFVVYEVKNDIVTVVIGTTLFCAGLLDAFHILASDKLIWAPHLEDVMIFTWLISRIFNASIILFASLIILSDNDFFDRLGAKSVYQVTWFFVLITLFTIIIVFFNVNLLPSITLPNSIIKKPLEIIPLIIFLINGAIILPIFYRKKPTIFAFALLLSMIPAIFTQAYVMFSAIRFDNYFMIARLLKALSYLIPFTGILVDYVVANRKERQTHLELKKAQEEVLRYQSELESKVEELNRSNAELEQFAYIASHDLQEPLRKIQAFGDRLSTKYSHQLKGEGEDYISRMKNASVRMQVLINDLLNFSRVKKANQKFEEIDLNVLVKEVLDDLETSIIQTGAKMEVNTLPFIHGDKRQLGQLFQNLISNAIKFHRKETHPSIKVSSRRITKEELLNAYNKMSEVPYFEIAISDNGIGFDNKYLDKVFTIFQRLHGRNEYEGTGIGLAICRKVVENHQGIITANSKPGEGTTFLVVLPENRAL